MNFKIKVLFNSVLLCIAGFSIISCKNFLTGEEVRKEIERQIYINNHECPVATVEEPAYSDSGVERNKAIVISFTLPIDPETFADSFEIVDFTNKSLKEHFMEPK